LGEEKEKEIMSTKTNLILDSVIFTGLLVVANPRLTGNTIHEWLGISLAGAILTHLLLHWDWIISVGKDFFKKLFHQSRLNFLVNTLFFISMTGSFFSGILISKDVMSTLGIQLNASGGWKTIHILLSDTSVILLGIHFALHWKWIVTNIGRYVVNPIRARFTRHPQAPILAVRTVSVEKHK
jgi:Domain of unknown function (DUF4405)